MAQLRDKVTKSLEGRASIYKFEEEPIAFGLVALIAHVMLPEDAGGQMQDVEDPTQKRRRHQRIASPLLETGLNNSIAILTIR